MTMLATFQAKRNFRWAVAALLCLMESILWILFIGLPWGWGESFGRAICEPDDADHWLTPFQRTTQGGWVSFAKSQHPTTPRYRLVAYMRFCILFRRKRTTVRSRLLSTQSYPCLRLHSCLFYADTFYLELLIILCHLLIAIVVPLSTLFQRGANRGGQRGRTGTGDLQGFTGVAVGSLRSAWWFTALAVGAVVIYIGQALAGFKLGFTWAEGVVENRWNEVALGTMLYDGNFALLYLTLTIGFSLASITGRWLLAGLSCTSATIFAIWCLFAVGAFIPLFFVSS
jgi:hypothetical protein